MLDTHARKFIQPSFNYIAKQCVKLGFSANKLTITALILGLAAALLNYFVLPIAAIIVLWLSGLIDALDGTVARLENNKSNLGAFLDITFDRVVELAILYSIYLRNPQLAFMLFVLCSTFLLSMTVFLTVGSLTANTSEKSFYYQAGITERTETFIFFTLMILLPKYTELIGYVFAFLVLITILTRFREGIKSLK